VKRLVWENLNAEQRALALTRPPSRSDAGTERTVRRIVEDVRLRGWDALVRHAKRLDGVEPRCVPTANLALRARDTLSAEQQAALELAASNIRTFHENSLPQDHWCETSKGIRVGKVWRPIGRIGLYVPGGAAPLFSTLLMLAIPARIAGVQEIIVVTPPSRKEGDSSLDPVVALAAELCGIEAVWTVGGAQAIAALAFGAGSIPEVDKICGPGNAFVAAAKAQVAALPGGPAIDLPAGPSELMIIADETAEADWVAADLLSQAEHDAEAQVFLVTPSERLARSVLASTARMIDGLPRSSTAKTALRRGAILVTQGLRQSVEIANLYAPEHLSLSTADAADLVGEVKNAGAVFVGHGAAESFGDYLNGPSHVLPTDGAARSWSGISVLSFMKAMSVHAMSDRAVLTAAKAAASLARMEGLEAHARSAEIRVGSLS
jgi:histidinol dehydrogenase